MGRLGDKREVGRPVAASWIADLFLSLEPPMSPTFPIAGDDPLILIV
jgi:hypothetical protein